MDSNKFIKKLAEEVEAIDKIKSPLYYASLWIATSTTYVLLFIFFIGLREDVLFKLQEPLFVFEIFIVLIAIIMSAVSSYILSVPDCYNKKWLTYLSLLPLVALTIYLFYGIASGDVNKMTVKMDHNSYMCAVDMGLYSIFPVAVMVFFLRKAATTNYYLCGFMASLAAVNISYLTLRLIEGNDESMHLLFWHYLPMLAIVTVVVMLSKKFLKW